MDFAYKYSKSKLLFVHFKKRKRNINHVDTVLYKSTESTESTVNWGRCACTSFNVRYGTALS